MKKWRAIMGDWGPGLLLAATGVGVGDMVSATIAGSSFGLTLVWALAAGVLLKLFITEGIARWQLATGTTLIEGWRDHLPRVALIAFFVYFVAWSYVVSSALIAASAMVPAAIFPAVSQPVWGLLHAVTALALIYWGTYERLLEMMKYFIGLMFTAVVAANLLILFSGVRWEFGASEGFSLPYALSLIGGVGGTVTLLSYGYWIREQEWTEPERIRSVRNDLGLSFALVFLFSFCMIFLSTQIEWEREILDEGPALSLLLADRIGRETGEIGRIVFLLGFWGAAYSSVLGVWHGVPYLFDDCLHLWRRRPAQGQGGRPYRLYAAFLTLAALSTLYLQRPVWLIFVYTVVGAVFFPFILSTLLWMNNQRKWVGESLLNRRLTNVVLAAALVLFIYLGLRSLLGS